MPKFNVGVQPQVIAHRITKLNKRQLDRAIRKFAKYFNIDNNLEAVVACGEWWGYSMGNSFQHVFVVLDGSEYSKMGFDTTEMWDLAISSETDPTVVQVI